MTSPGSWLRDRREELHLTRSGVERLTSESASEAANERYRIRRGRLADLEEGKSAPDIFEAASLSECYKVPYSAVLQAFGMKLGESRSMSESSSISHELSKQWSFSDTDRPFSLTFQNNISFDATRLVACRSEFVTTDAAGGVGVFPLDRLRVSGVGVDVAAEFAS
jgi:transcriptional regulator with XRE-family HTH domain